MNSPNRRFDCRHGGCLRRPGFTLIEVVTAVGMVAFVMTSVAVTISSLHQVNKKIRDEFPASAMVGNLGLRLRTDAHAARQATLAADDNGAPLLRLTLSDQRLVEYSAKQEQVWRYVRLGDQVERREVFSLARGSKVEWTAQADTMSLVKLTIRSHVGQAPAAEDNQRVMTITAAVGLDHSKGS